MVWDLRLAYLLVKRGICRVSMLLLGAGSNAPDFEMISGTVKKEGTWRLRFGSQVGETVDKARGGMKTTVAGLARIRTS